MATYVQTKPLPQQFSSIYQFSLIKIVVLHQLSLQNISWDTFVAHEVFKIPHVTPSMFHEEGGPSSHPYVHETKPLAMLVFVTYEKGTRKLFAATK